MNGRSKKFVCNVLVDGDKESKQKLSHGGLKRKVSFNDQVKSKVIGKDTSITLLKKDNINLKSILKTSNVSSAGEYVDMNSVERSSKKFRKDIQVEQKSLSYTLEEILKQKEKNEAEKLGEKPISLKDISDAFGIDLTLEVEVTSKDDSIYIIYNPVYRYDIENNNQDLLMGLDTIPYMRETAL